MIPQFLKKIVVFAGLWALLVYSICIALPFHYFNAEYPMWLSKMELLEKQDDNRNYILGDSRAIAGLEAKTLGADYYNLALGGGTPMEGYFMLKKMLEANKKIDTLIISYAPIHLEQSEMFWDRQLKYNFYQKSDVEFIFDQLNPHNEYFWEYANEGAYSNKNKSQLLTRAYAVLYKNPMEFRPELTKSFLLRGYSNYKVYQAIKERKGSFDFGTQNGCNQLNIEAKRENFIPKKILVNCLEETFKLAKRHNIQVVCISSPMNSASFNKLTATYREGVLDLYKTLRQKYPEALFFDAGLVSYEPDFFGDESHLNAAGRQKFSIAVKNTLREKRGNFQYNLLSFSSDKQ